MPLTTDEKLIATSSDLISQFDKVFGLHPGFRPVHARGALLSGTFTPTPNAATLSSAPHFSTNKSTPITARFSSSTGIPQLPDTDPSANPRGFAIRFNLGDHVHTDIVAHSTPAFPVRTGEEFLEFFKAVASTAPGAASPTPVEQFLGSHPAALAFVTTPKPSPSAFGREEYFGLNAFKFTNSAGVSRYGRYGVVPEAGIDHLSEEAIKLKGPDFLFDELAEHLKEEGPISFRLRVQLADKGDLTDDITIQWPKDRTVVELGTISLTALVDDNDKEQKHIIFDPIPRVEGIEPSRDPLLEFRAAIYLISGRRRRAAPAS